MDDQLKWKGKYLFLKGSILHIGLFFDPVIFLLQYIIWTYAPPPRATRVKERTEAIRETIIFPYLLHVYADTKKDGRSAHAVNANVTYISPPMLFDSRARP